MNMTTTGQTKGIELIMFVQEVSKIVYADKQSNLFHKATLKSFNLTAQSHNKKHDISKT